MKLLNNEQFTEIMTDISILVSEVKNARNDFNKEFLIKEIVEEFRLELRGNPLLKNFEKVILRAEERETSFKNIKQKLLECKRKCETKMILVGIGGIIFGGGFVILCLKTLGRI